MTKSISHQLATKLESFHLPKWPQMLVWGKSVTLEQAKDIILRTDRFFSEVTNFPDGGNRSWIEWAQGELGFRHLVLSDLPAARRLAAAAEEALQSELGVVRTLYVHNTWASSSFGMGPYGWCHPDGTIWYEYNVGKDPGVRCLFEEWQRLAEAFPYLDLTVTFFDGERLDATREPVVSFQVKDGEVTLLPATVLPKERLKPEQSSRKFNSYDEELAAQQGLPNDWIREYGVTTKKIYSQIK